VHPLAAAGSGNSDSQEWDNLWAKEGGGRLVFPSFSFTWYNQSYANQWQQRWLGTWSLFSIIFWGDLSAGRIGCAEVPTYLSPLNALWGKTVSLVSTAWLKRLSKLMLNLGSTCGIIVALTSILHLHALGVHGVCLNDYPFHILLLCMEPLPIALALRPAKQEVRLFFPINQVGSRGLSTGLLSTFGAGQQNRGTNLCIGVLGATLWAHRLSRHAAELQADRRIGQWRAMRFIGNDRYGFRDSFADSLR
jgi:hypothetical protein